ncbi:hypothetical protein WN944_024159 [Citrus x changshan-huyou]|uniref:Integrase catalytic domain-containing protein n=1 Tax=Citrus x changshan-huyou TaxID=2935761 RepID=A0AAP0LN05_9ROSI
MRDDIEAYVRTCLACQQDKVNHQLLVGLLEPLPIASRPWESVTMDFISALPKSEGCGSIMVVVDRYSKYTTFIVAPTDCKADEAARLFVKHIVKLWGVPKSIVSDRDPRFTGRFWTELFKLLGTDLKFSTSFHPQTDGQTECINSLLEMYLRHYVSAHQRDWAKLLDVAQFSYNLQLSEATSKSPFEIIMGFRVHLISILVCCIRHLSHEDLSHQALVRQAACRTKLRATGSIFFYLSSNLIRQPKQQNKISLLILQNPILEFKFPGIFHQKPRSEMLGGLYGDLPPPSDEDKPTNTTTTIWSIFAPPQTILKPQSKPKTTQNSLPTRPHSSPAIAPFPDDVAVLPQPALVSVTSTVIEEYDPARPNDYEDYRREKKKKAVDAEIRRELERRRQEEEEREMRERGSLISKVLSWLMLIEICLGV